MQILLLVLIIFILLFLITFAYAGLRAAPWVPTFKIDINRSFNLINVKKDDIFIDLGSGHGSVLRAAAARGAKAIGFEISLFPYLLSLFLNIFHSKRKNIKVKFRDFWFVNLSKADFVYVFLQKQPLKKLKIKLEKELKQGAVVICQVWEIPGWTPIKSDIAPGLPPIYVYQIK